MADPNCPKCHGHGLIFHADLKGPPVSDVCTCVLRDQIIANMERGMRGLSKAEPLSSGGVSPLSKFVDKDLWITASPDWLRSHLRHTIARMPNAYRWGFKVVTDSDLVVAWLATAALQGTNIRDADFHSEAAPVSLNKLTLVDIADPPELLIIRLGVKAARNSATPEVLLEALTHRAHMRKPTWLWDQPDNRLTEGHLSYSHMVVEFAGAYERIQHADHMEVVGGGAKVARPARVALGVSAPPVAEAPAAGKAMRLGSVLLAPPVYAKKGQD